MIKKYKYGFIYNGILYGWHKKELYKLSQTVNKRSYSEKKLNQILIGNKVGYRVGKDQKTIDQLAELTHYINKEYQNINDEDLPI
ncbi:MAG: hypothetical protein ABIJ40_15815 [Bacteroidota bacterium]